LESCKSLKKYLIVTKTNITPNKKLRMENLLYINKLLHMPVFIASGHIVLNVFLKVWIFSKVPSKDQAFPFDLSRLIFSFAF
jgi:hypothetical protein